MPELPEVETVKRGLGRLIVGKIITGLDYDNQKSYPNGSSDTEAFLINAKIIKISRRAKLIIIDLSTKYSLIVHLKMTGQLVYLGKERFGAGHPNDSLIGTLPDKSTRVTITFSDDSKLYFNDQRKFGWIKLIPTVEVKSEKFYAKLGPEPLSGNFTAAKFAERLRTRSRTNIKAALLDQSVIAGVGNIYADESLWGAKIHPRKLVGDLSTQKITKLYNELIYILKLSIKKGGSSNRNYVNAEGKKGSFSDFARVFRREKQACPRCGTSIVKIRVAGRGTHLCPRCQKL